MQNRSFLLPLSNGQKVPVLVEGRTPFERRIQREEQALKTAAADQIVSVELYFHQFWRPFGHTSLRIGESLYEFTTSGWRVHGSGADNPRAFIFNNPFFRKQMRLFQSYGMKPLSLGVTLYVPKHKAEKAQIILENKCATKTFFKKERFNIATRNCNHMIMDVLKTCELDGFESTGFEGFSSVMSFNKLLKRSSTNDGNKVGYGPVRAYPLPGYEYDMNELRSWIYPWIYGPIDPRKEFIRAFPLYVHSLLLNLKSFLQRA